MSESLAMRFLYGTTFGRFLLKLFVKSSWFSNVGAKYLSSPLSKRMISRYVKKYNINLQEFDQQTFPSFNDFFKRTKTLEIVPNPKNVISPCDAYLSIYRISDKLQLPIKHSQYTVTDLLEDKDLSQKFAGGLCCVFRLEPKHYHHYVYTVGGDILTTKRIDGVLHSVRPIACEAYPVWFQNSREYTVIKNVVFGDVVQMEIGALLVGKICNQANTQAVQGQEKGYFEFGGSTIMVLFQNHFVSLTQELQNIIDSGEEIPIEIGKVLGTV